MSSIWGTCHYHTGKEPGRNPEKIFVISGAMVITFIGKTGALATRIVVAGQVVSIWPNVIHFAKAVGDSNLIFAEYQFGHFDPKNPDVVKIAGIF